MAKKKIRPLGDRVIVEGNERLFPNTPLDPRPYAETRAANNRGGRPAR